MDPVDPLSLIQRVCCDFGIFTNKGPGSPVRCFFSIWYFIVLSPKFIRKTFALIMDEMAKIIALDKNKRYYIGTPEQIAGYKMWAPDFDAQE